MATGPVLGEGNDEAREKQGFSEYKVYTRKAFKRPTRQNDNATTATAAVAAARTKTSTTTFNNNKSATITAATTTVNTTTVTGKENCWSEKDRSNISVETPGQTVSGREAPPGKASSYNPPQPAVLSSSGNGAMKEGLDCRINIDLGLRSMQEKRELRRKLKGELDMVRSVVKRIEAKQGQIHNLHVLVDDGVDDELTRTTSQVTSVGIPREVSRHSRPLNQISVSVLENSQGGSEHVEKEKRTPKANQFYKNSEFLLAKDKFPTAESNKKTKLKVKKQGGEKMGHGFRPGAKVFKNCSALLERLMKHKHGWVFDAPVDVKGLGLHDYFTIIKHPMDLGTVKSRFTKSLYNSPREFAEDVRLTFCNAMTYNPKGHDVHTMAEQLLELFEDRWAIIEADYNREMRFAADYEMNIPTPTSRKASSIHRPLVDVKRMLDRSESITRSVDHQTKHIISTPSSRAPAPKKPKAKDSNKREMTYEEKQKLSVNLQSLPPEKLDQIVQIIKKRNSTLCQNDDEIEVDIDSVDNETLWELDRFVINYKKGLSKKKRKAELILQAKAGERNVHEKNPAPAKEELQKETNMAAERDLATSLPEAQKLGDNASRSDSSSSSSSDSGSSSSDSESESSSVSGSDAGHSPRK